MPEKVNIQFKRTPYLDAVRDSPRFSDEKKIFDYAENHLQFKYGDVCYDQFSKKYSSSGWIGRKLLALPAAIWSGVVQTIYHIGKAVLFGTVRAVFGGNAKYLQAQIFYIARNLQESLGRFISLFHDRCGQYHILEAQFQKSCYDFFIANGAAYDRSWTVKFGVLIDNELKTISLAEYKTKTARERHKLIERFGLRQASSQLGTSGKSLADFVNQADSGLLELLTLEDVIIPLKYSKLQFALLDNQTFCALTPDDLQKELTDDQLHFIRKRVEKVSGNQKDTEQVVFDEKQIKTLPIKDLSQLNPRVIAKHHKVLPAMAFAFFTNVQLQSIQLSDLTSAQNKAVFRALDPAGLEERLVQFSVTDVAAAIQKGLLTGNVLKILRDEHFSHLQVHVLSEGQILKIFDEGKADETIDKRRFALFRGDEVQKALERGILSEYQIGLISAEQIEKFDFSAISQKAVNLLFPPFTVAHLKKKYSYDGLSFQMKNGKVLESRQGNQCIYTEEQLIALSQKLEKEGRALFEQLSLKQKQDVELRLYQEDCTSSDGEDSPSEHEFFDDFFQREFGKSFSGFFPPHQFFKTRFGAKPTLSKNASYQKLGLPLTASEEEIKQAYKKLALRCHPDKNPRQPDESEEEYNKRTTDRFAEISTAFACLMEKVSMPK